jgi:hypothetical protein
MVRAEVDTVFYERISTHKIIIKGLEYSLFSPPYGKINFLQPEYNTVNDENTIFDYFKYCGTVISGNVTKIIRIVIQSTNVRTNERMRESTNQPNKTNQLINQ